MNGRQDAVASAPWMGALLVAVSLALATAREASPQPTSPAGGSSAIQQPVRSDSIVTALRAPDLAVQRRVLPATVRPQQAGEPNQVGYVREAPTDLGRASWIRSADGSRVARLELSSAGATGLRVSLRRRDLPDGLEIRFYVPESQQVRGPYRPERTGAGEEWWSPLILGSEIGIEFSLGPADADLPPPAIRSVAYRYAVMELPCHNPIANHPEWAVEAGGVAKISYLDLDCENVIRMFECTAFLLNRTIVDFAPVAMTAAHCIDDEGAARTVDFFWFFDAATATPVQTSGARMLNFHHNNDCTLLALDERPPGGTAFLTYDIGPWPSDPSITGIHHPGGTFKRISFGTFTGGGFDFFDMCGSRVINNFGVTYSSGTQEGGSSGSPLFDSNRHVRGPLTGPDGQGCIANPVGKYGRLDGAFSNFQAYLTTMTNPIWLDASYGGFEVGNAGQPFRDLIKAAAVVRAGEQIAIRPGVYEKTTLYRPMTLTAPSGNVTIGP